MPSNNPDPQQYVRAQPDRSDLSPTAVGWTVAKLATATGETPKTSSTTREQAY